MLEKQEIATIDVIFNVATSTLGRESDPIAALGLIIAICRYGEATPFTANELAQFNPYGEDRNNA